MTSRDNDDKKVRRTIRNGDKVNTDTTLKRTPAKIFEPNESKSRQKEPKKNQEVKPTKDTDGD